MIDKRAYRLIGDIQNYAWGCKNEKAFIPQLTGQPVEEGKPYAELWLGSHPKCPSQIDLDGQSLNLAELSETDQEKMYSKNSLEQYGQGLPYLLKVLSAGEPLSIQAHPNKKQAGILHAQLPEHYPDDNHKPEIAIAMDSLLALIGFRAFSVLQEAFKELPEIVEFIGPQECQLFLEAKPSNEQEEKDSLKALFGCFIKQGSDEKQLAQCLSKLAERLNQKDELNGQEELFTQLYPQYPQADIGLLCIFFLNLVHLKKGEGVFLKACVPHAYLSGNIIECMANSDNVIRVGLTPKFKDGENLVKMLSYEMGPISIMGSADIESDIIYQPDVDEFEITRFSFVDELTKEYEQSKCSIGIVLSGEVTIKYPEGTSHSFKKGESFILPAILTEMSFLGNADTEFYLATGK
ncbi:MAG: mannose-6-phosphate isomerase, class I [Planctomycetes bacterium]|nr:mannose-6-phosphate isomerase, class I [Planctomycetota bacterium]